uniref:Uncharacterized protein n=1 Tax=Serinus canaria TaxID=9135 RepID=A0A8C9KXC1_SERCA
MAGFGVANERLRALEELEREIGASLHSAGGRNLCEGAGFARSGRGAAGAGRAAVLSAQVCPGV